jgi:hypothetical protein
MGRGSLMSDAEQWRRQRKRKDNCTAFNGI